MHSKYVGVYRAHDGKHALSAQGWAKLPPIAKDVAVHAISNQNNLAEDDVRRELDAGHRQLRLVLLQFSNHAMKFRNKMNEIEGKTQSTARAHVVPRVIPLGAKLRLS
ncbi:hypothetical protein A0H81_04904 [Grifola frondosa]|uniref:Uncharacterized protein n=1 Tax=Grifola frondosa TaxID=5627 RepID=A0A1C7MF60_GRIFR|nr:hypothetical protein A0H81_04904 [Grifola frondosa]